jgi:hypothetical protein
MFSRNFEDLAQICGEALKAFSLVLATTNVAKDDLTASDTNALEGEAEIEPALNVLKSDDFSLVVKVRCVHANIYVLKCVRAEYYFGSEETALVQNSLMQFSGSDRLSASNGSYLFHQILPTGDLAVWSLSRFVPNEPSFDWLDASPAWTDAHCHSAGSMLALLHHRAQSISEKFLYAPFSKLNSIIPSIPKWLKKAFADGEPSSQSSSKNFNHAAFLPEGELSATAQALILEKIEEIIAHLRESDNLNDQLSEPHQIFPRKDLLMIHGDFHPGNVLFVDDKAICAIDWDYAHLEDPFLELAYGMVMFSSKFALPGHNSLDQALARRFLQGYCAGCRKLGWSIYRTTSDLRSHVSTDQRGFDCDAQILSILMLPYIKLAASLILLWALSKRDLHCKQQSEIVHKAVRLIFSTNPLDLDHVRLP